MAATLRIRQAQLEKVLKEKSLEVAKAERFAKERDSLQAKYTETRDALEQLRAERTATLLPDAQHRCAAWHFPSQCHCMSALQSP